MNRSSRPSPWNRRDILAAAGSVSAAALLPHSVTAQAWPVPQITLVAPFPPGGTVDQTCRLVQQGLQQRLGVTIIIENKAGAQGSIGTNVVVKSKPDGGTWVVVFDTHAVNPTLQPLPFDTEKDLDPVLLIGTSPHVLVCHPSRPWKTFDEVKAAALKDPGKLTYGSIGTGSLGHLTTVLLNKKIGIDMTHVPYRGGGPLLNDAVAGHIDLAMASVALFNTQIGGNQLRPLLQTGATRSGNAKDTPTAIEAGLAGFESYAWWGVFAPKGTPKELNDRMRTAFVETLKEAGPNKTLTDTMQITPVFGGPAELADWVSTQMKLWGDVVRDNGIKAGN